MEREANYTVVGAFVLLVATMAGFFVYWYAGSSDARDYKRYEIYFKGSVSGLNRGSTVQFKVDTNAANYRFDIYRMGYYGGLGARKITTVNPSASLPQNQPNCLTQASSGLIDGGTEPRLHHRSCRQTAR